MSFLDDYWYMYFILRTPGHTADLRFCGHFLHLLYSRVLKTILKYTLDYIYAQMTIF